MKIRADLLLYYFIDADMLYSIDVLSLKRWVFGRGDGTGMWGSGKLRECRQGQYSQLNDTWGVLAPVAKLHAELPRGAMRFTKVRQRDIVEAA